MKKRRLNRFGLSVVFSLVVFLIFLITALIVLSLALLALHLGLVERLGLKYAFPLIPVALLASAIVGTLVALMLGSITAVFGGVTRDVLCNEIPKVYRDHQPYTLCTLIGGLLFIGLNHFGVSPHLSSLAGICCISGLRLLAVAYGWQIPSWPRDA